MAPPPAAQAQDAGCEGARPDSLVSAVPPIYRECDVTRKAERRGREPVLDFNPVPSSLPEDRCLHATFTFLVDSTGSVEPATILFQQTNFAAFAAAVAKSLAELRYRPAEREGRRVRQRVVYRRTSAEGIERGLVPFQVGRVTSLDRPDPGMRPPGATNSGRC